MPHRHSPTAPPLDDYVDAAVLQRLDADARAALDFLVDRAAEIPGGHEIAECLTRSHRRRRGPVVGLRAG